MSCGCAAVADRESWHRYRQTAICDAAVENRRERARAKYARQRARQGVVVKPMVPRRWLVGAAIEVPELDPL